MTTATQQNPATGQLPGIAWFTVMSMVSPVALNILMPALPDIAADLNVSTDEVQLSLTLYLLTLAFGQLICGPLADRFGRKPVLLAGIALHFVGCLLGAFADDLQSLLLARVLQAAGAVPAWCSLAPSCWIVTAAPRQPARLATSPCLLHWHRPLPRHWAASLTYCLAGRCCFTSHCC
nr:MFS transporter [Aliamphritea spongicola]